MWALYSLLALLALIALCLLLVFVLILVVFLTPIFLRLTYDGSFHLRMRVLFLPVYLFAGLDETENLRINLRVLGKTIPLYPMEKKEEEEKAPPLKKAEEEKTPVEKEKPVEAEKTQPEQKKPSKFEELVEEFRKNDLSAILDFLKELAQASSRTVNRVLRAITITSLDWQMLIATGDPAETAQLYGQVCSVFYPAVALLGHKVRIRRRRLRVEPNFLLEQSDVRFDIRAKMAVPRLMYAGAAFLLKTLVLINNDKDKLIEEVS